jgi:hypothetical protein
MTQPIVEERLLILPCDPEYSEALGQSLPPDWLAVAEKIGQACAFVVSPESGLMRPATPAELDDYLYGGEYEKRLEQSGDPDDLA